MDAQHLFTISRAAKAADLSVHPVRGYVGVGLVDYCGCTAGGYRLFDQRSIERLQFIETGLAVGLALREIGAYLKALDIGDATRLAREQRRLEDRIQQLRRTLDALDAQLQCMRR